MKNLIMAILFWEELNMKKINIKMMEGINLFIVSRILSSISYIFYIISIFSIKIVYLSY